MPRSEKPALRRGRPDVSESEARVEIGKVEGRRGERRSGGRVSCDSSPGRGQGIGLKVTPRGFLIPAPLEGEGERECLALAGISLGGGKSPLDSCLRRACPRLERGNDEGKTFRPRKSQIGTLPGRAFRCRLLGHSATIRIQLQGGRVA